jgi:hypothetical protein
MALAARAAREAPILRGSLPQERLNELVLSKASAKIAWASRPREAGIYEFYRAGSVTAFI